MLDSEQSKGTGLGSYVVVLLVLPLVSFMIAKFTGMSEHCFVIAIQFSFMHILLSNILSVYYSTLASYVNITILRKYSGNRCACTSNQYRAASLLPRSLGTRLLGPMRNLSHTLILLDIMFLVRDNTTRTSQLQHFVVDYDSVGLIWRQFSCLKQLATIT